ncbi:MAG: hypothetical protein KGL39_32440 [Patescibacteria group bacterium]|nr:hypothetical protein [Patescibacteria group bacterium]
MILGAIYSLIHFVLGIVAAFWTVKRLGRAGYSDGCLRFAAAVIAFLFWPLALAVLIVDWLFDAIVEGNGK